MSRILKFFYSGDNGISNNGVKFLADTLKTNKTLKNLNLKFNDIDSVGMQYLLEALQINNGLTLLGITNSDDICKNIKAHIDKKLQTNLVNQKRSRCLQILCLEKIKQLNRIDEIKILMPATYESCMRKYHYR